MNYAQHVSTRVTPQREAIPGSTQVANSAGGYSFEVDDWTRLDRFLILGSEGGSYYASEHKMTVDNAAVVMRCLKTDGVRAVRRIVSVSVAGYAPKNDPALFALALAAGANDPLVRATACEALPQVARTGTHLFTFADYAEKFRGWGPTLRKAVGAWYTAKEPDDLAYQLVKYRQRAGWTHRDLLRLSHPRSDSPVLRWVVKGPDAETEQPLPAIIGAYQRLEAATNEAEVVGIIETNPGVPWEIVPSVHLGSVKVWAALLGNLPMTALVRNLGRMTANGLLAPMSEAVHQVTERLADVEAIKRARLHPIAVLNAMLTYKGGSGVKGNLQWEPVAAVVDALDAAFYSTFQTVVPAGKRTLLALDVSGSMGMCSIAGVPALTPRVASTAMAMVTDHAEPMTHVMAFCDRFVPLAISSRQRLDDALRTVDDLPFGRTDCSLPMQWATKTGTDIDTFVVYTDSETWFGNIHPVQALRAYREKTGIPAKLVVVSMLANKFSIADPDDGGMLDVVGFDTSTPRVMSGFSAGMM